MNIREKYKALFKKFFEQNKKVTVREAANETGISKSSAHRYRQGVKLRNQYPESFFWETEAGYDWLIILVCATLYIFGIRCCTGTETISLFFKTIRLDRHIGVSPSSLNRMISDIEKYILKYKETYEKDNNVTGHGVVGADETFFDKMILVMIELTSGYIVLEEPSEDRTYETWKEKSLQALKNLGIKPLYMVSDNAKALVKLGLKGIGCNRIPDLFHAMNEIAKVMGVRFANKAASTHRKLSEAIIALEFLIESDKCSPEKIQEKQIQIELLQDEHKDIIKGQTNYYKELHNFTKNVHPFSIDSNLPRTSEDVQKTLLSVIQSHRNLAEEYGIKDNKNGLGKVEKQIPDIAALIDIWWVWTKESIMQFDLDEEKADWMLYYFLPTIYWQTQLKRTSSEALREDYKIVVERVLDSFTNHPLTSNIPDDEMEQYQSWAHWIVTKFQRTSSAVEGRNGVLSRMNHNQRSIPTTRLKVSTVIHNFGIKRRDGTTSAERLFGKKFPDLFEWIVEQMEDLPLARCHSLTL